MMKREIMYPTLSSFLKKTRLGSQRHPQDNSDPARNLRLKEVKSFMQSHTARSRAEVHVPNCPLQTCALKSHPNPHWNITGLNEKGFGKTHVPKSSVNLEC